MGLCKCPKRKVTNQFCFEHRVNVCEHCMVTNHPKCIVQSYLRWLQDSDCKPVCEICSENLSNRDCVRLTCYHVYHWSCLDNYARNLPITTAPSGYLCPTCELPIFPQNNLVSPVADVLKEKLATVNWARAGLGLPLLSDDREQKPAQDHKPSTMADGPSYPINSTSNYTVATSRPNAVNSTDSLMSNNYMSNQKLGPPYSVVNIDSNIHPNPSGNRKIFEAYDDPKGMMFDHDENKYQRKSAIEWFIRWWKLITRPPMHRRNSSGSVYKRYAMLTIVGIFVFVCIIILMSWLGRIATDGDPAFNLYAHSE